MSVNGDLTSHGASGVDGIMFLFLTLLIGLFCKVIWADVKFLREWFPLPYTVIIFIIGLTWGYCTPKYSDGGDLDDGLNRVIGIDPHLFMLAFIPPLLFEAGFGLNIHVYKKVTHAVASSIAARASASTTTTAPEAGSGSGVVAVPLVSRPGGDCLYDAICVSVLLRIS